jgi:hypothetical protein
MLRRMPRRPKPADPKPPHVQPRRPLPGLTAREERAWGRRLRAETPRRSFGLWEPAADRPDPIAILAGQTIDDHAALVAAVADGRVEAITEL